MPITDQRWLLCHGIMGQSGFRQHRIFRSFIWAAKKQHCTTCGAEPNHPCYNMADIDRDVLPQFARQNKWPHQERVDYNRLLEALHLKGYCLKQREACDFCRGSDRSDEWLYYPDS